jgi:ankyrin repeat protein
LVSTSDDRGWTLLHQESLAGNAATVRALLDAGADPKVKTHDGMTPLQLAQSLGWENVAALLRSR